MAENATDLSIRLCLASGRSHGFQAGDAEGAKRLLQALDPERVFDRDILVVAGHHEEAAFRASEIRRIEVRAATLPKWPFGPMIERAELIDIDEFDQLRRARADLDREDNRIRADSGYDGLLELEDSTGERSHLMVHGQSIAPVLRAGVLGRLLEASFLHARGTGVATVFNPSHIAGARLFPGLPELPVDALQAERLEDS